MQIIGQQWRTQKEAKQKLSYTDQLSEIFTNQERLYLYVKNTINYDPKYIEEMPIDRFYKGVFPEAERVAKILEENSKKNK